MFGEMRSETPVAANKSTESAVRHERLVAADNLAGIRSGEERWITMSILRDTDFDSTMTEESGIMLVTCRQVKSTVPQASVTVIAQ